MPLVELLRLLRENWGVLASFGGGAAGWYGNVAKTRLQKQRNEIDAEQLENEQLQLALNRERFLTDRLTELGTECDVLWRRLYEREGVIKDYHSAALSARRLVNELEIRTGAAVTVFADLPEFPPVEEEKAVAGHAATIDRGEHYGQPDEGGAPSPPGSALGGRKAEIGQADNRPAARD